MFMTVVGDLGDGQLKWPTHVQLPPYAQSVAHVPE
jgi:hypothetical protein